MMQKPQPPGYTGKLFLSPAEVARELRVSTSTVLRLIHAEKLPAIYVSERIYRIPVASFEMFKSGTLRKPGGLAALGPMTELPSIGEGEPLPDGPTRFTVPASTSGRR
jgi:excisionase family DNA binding protein